MIGDVSACYRDYIHCLNSRDWARLHYFVRNDVVHNGRSFGIRGYREMLERDFAEVPDLRFEVELLACEPPYVASRLVFDCSPRGTFLGLPVDGKRVSFSENVFYRYEDGKIREVWSVIDKAAIEAQLDGARRHGSAGDRSARSPGWPSVTAERLPAAVSVKTEISPEPRRRADRPSGRR